jgi:hypothetical protein
VANDERAEQDAPEEERPEDIEVSETEADEVRGGKTPSPGGPVPIPYPN